MTAPDSPTPDEQDPGADPLAQSEGDQQHDGVDAAFAEDASIEIGQDLEAELAEAKSNALRAQAELENQRKRMERQMQEVRKFASESLIRDLLPVLDNLERALQAVSGEEADSPLAQGVKMVAEQFLHVLDQNHCKRIEAAGSKFDPNIHEAIAQIPSDAPAGNVLEVTQIGYQLHERVIRPTQVVVSQGPPDNA